MRNCPAPGAFYPGLSVLLGTWLALLWPGPVFAATLFGPPSPYGVDGVPLGVRAGAFDNEPGLDLVTLNQAGENGPSLSLLSNRGEGRFSAEERMPLDVPGFVPLAFASADFDADGHDDIAVAGDDQSAFPPLGKVLVLLNDGLGAFLLPDEYELGGFEPQCVEAADVTGDGVTDLVVCHGGSAGGVPVGFLAVLTAQTSAGRPTGAFSAPTTIAVGTAPAAAAVGRLDDDARPDVVVADIGEETLFVLYGRAAGGILAPPVPLAEVSYPSAVAIADIDETPRPDVLATSFSTNRLITLSQTASRRFAAPRSVLIGLGPAAMAVADVITDGNDDLVVVSQLGAELWLGDGTGSFGFGESLTRVPSLDDVTLGDLDGDGDLDVVASSSAADEVVAILQNSPLGPGDANCDRRIDRLDLDALVSAIFAPGCSGADVNEDGAVSAADLPALVELLAGPGSL